jgi:hypothetical protein
VTSPAIPAYGERQALPVDAFRKQLDQMLAGVNLDGALALQQPGLQPDQLQAALIAARFFNTRDGKILLEFIADNSVRRPQALPPLGTDPVQAYLQVQRRAGQDDMFFFILKLIATGREEQPPAREGAGL